MKVNIFAANEWVMTNEYKNRIADQLLSDKLEAMGAVLIEGPKGCGNPYIRHEIFC